MSSPNEPPLPFTFDDLDPDGRFDALDRVDLAPYVRRQRHRTETVGTPQQASPAVVEDRTGG
jgi:hypothetical protein